MNLENYVSTSPFPSPNAVGTVIAISRRNSLCVKEEQAMVDTDTLEMVLDKAVTNGYDEIHLVEYAFQQDGHVRALCLQGLLVSHRFAKAFFGTHEVLSGNGRTFDEYYKGARTDQQMSPKTIQADWNYWRSSGMVIPAWQYHLKQMVVQEQPLRYLEQFLEEEPAYATRP
jgi:hypothetical protein